jgi:hypothetical protein
MRFRSLLVEARAFVDYGNSSDAVILSEATEKKFRPASLAGRAGAKSKDLLLFAGFDWDRTDFGHASSRQSGQVR